MIFRVYHNQQTHLESVCVPIKKIKWPLESQKKYESEKNV